MVEYIERETAIGMAISGRIRALPTTEYGEDWIRVEEVRESLLGIPPADVTPMVHGRWKLLENGDGICSVCRYTSRTVWDMDRWQNFCGHCGAKMDLEGQP